MNNELIPQRNLGTSAIRVSAVALGCWPIAGMTSLNVEDAASRATIAACFDLGVNFLDTAYCYGAQGESERLIAQAIRGRRDELVLATKCGIHWDERGERQFDGRPERLRQECETSLRRLETDRVELLYLHAPDPRVPVTESAGELRRLQEEGKTRTVGVSNFNVEQLEAFHRICPIAAVQPPYNMLQRQIEQDVLPWCLQNGVSLAVYWPLMKGLLAGKLPRDYVFAPGDGRAKYPMFHGEEWQRNQDFLDELRVIASELGRSVADVVVNWTIHQPGITVALCGAKRPDQIRESAAALTWRLNPEQLSRIDDALVRRGAPVSRPAV